MKGKESNQQGDTPRQKRVGVYAGSFDPFTNGHLDIAIRAAKLVDELIIAIGVNPAKSGYFSIEERKDIIFSVTESINNIAVDTFQGLLVQYCMEKSATTIIRGLRNTQDYEFEATLGRANRHLQPEIETILLLSDTDSVFVSSSLMKEIVLNGGTVQGLVPDLAVELFTKRQN